MIIFLQAGCGTGQHHRPSQPLAEAVVEVIKNQVKVHDLHATLLQLLGSDHTKLTCRFQGRDFRLTDVEREVVGKLLA